MAEIHRKYIALLSSGIAAPNFASLLNKDFM
jgi:hypothetical protein